VVQRYGYDRRRSSAAAPPAALSLGLAIVLSFAIVVVALQLLRGVPEPQVNVTLPQSSVMGQAVAPPLPDAGESVVSVVGLGTLGASGPDTPRPIASVTKMMTAYVILHEKPLQPGQSGPTVTVTQEDANRYWVMIGQDQSVVPVNPGETLTELQLLQGMLVPSGNNFAEILAKWSAGSVEAFTDKMNAAAQALGMTNTRYADASGFSSKSVSTAKDQLTLARELMKDPVFASIVGTKTVDLPVAGSLDNVNELLGTDGIVGIKTGFTEDAGGNLAFAANREAAGQQIQVVGVVLGQPDRPAAFSATQTVIKSLNQYLQVTRVVPAGQPVGTVKPAWGSTIDVVTGQEVDMLSWPGMTLETSVEIDDPTPPKSAHGQVGWLTVKLGEQEQRVPLVLATDIGSADLVWKLTRF
jgi:D-alanyl-D-alanine carboxypeptidase (penicillin-binding protein 5/6)